MKNNKEKISKGFTLIELLVVISIISFLSSIILASLNTAREKARVSRAKADVRLIIQAISIAQGEQGRPLIYFSGNSNCFQCYCSSPNSAACLQRMSQTLSEIESATNGLVKGLTNIKSDPWGNAYYFDSNQGETGAPSCSNVDGFWIAGGNQFANFPSIPLSSSCP